MTLFSSEVLAGKNGLYTKETFHDLPFQGSHFAANAVLLIQRQILVFKVCLFDV